MFPIEHLYLFIFTSYLSIPLLYIFIEPLQFPSIFLHIFLILLSNIDKMCGRGHPQLAHQLVLFLQDQRIFCHGFLVHLSHVVVVLLVFVIGTG